MDSITRSKAGRERRWRPWIPGLVVMLLLATSGWIAQLEQGSMMRSLWPALVALGAIVATRHAIAGLSCGVAAGAMLLANGDLVEALRIAFEDHGFPAMQGPWHIGALVFTLLLGGFAGVLEHSGGFESILRSLLKRGGRADRRLLGGVYGIGLLCFFDGLANSLLCGRIARPLADRAGVAREKLAWVVDSTSSPVACVAFISTWIATQLSLIQIGLANAPFEVDPYGMFFASIPANAYCLLTLMLVPLAIATGYEPRAMRKFSLPPPTGNELVGSGDSNRPPTSMAVVLVPLGFLIAGILAGFALLAGQPVNPLTISGWRIAFSGAGGPYALVIGSLVGLAAAFLMTPPASRPAASRAAVAGAGSLLPALVVLVLAWALGSMFEALGAGDAIADGLGTWVSICWMPLAVFACASLVAFATGSSWGTMGLLMPLTLPALLRAGELGGMPAAEIQAIAPLVISAVFGGAVFGDHCSPFSDTTIVSALASGCHPVDHVTSQLPYAFLTFAAACIAYAIMAVGLAPWLATGAALVLIAAWVLWRAKSGGAVSGADR